MVGIHPKLADLWLLSNPEYTTTDTLRGQCCTRDVGESYRRRQSQEKVLLNGGILPAFTARGKGSCAGRMAVMPFLYFSKGQNEILPSFCTENWEQWKMLTSLKLHLDMWGEKAEVFHWHFREVFYFVLMGNINLVSVWRWLQEEGKFEVCSVALH